MNPDDLLNSVKTLMRPEVLAALTIAPFVLQWAKFLVPQLFTRERAALAALAVAAVLVLTQAWGSCAWPCMVLQVLLGWIWTDQVYNRVVEPMAKSSNPLVPPNPGG